MPPWPAPRLFRAGPGPGRLRQLRHLRHAPRDLGRHGPGTEGAVDGGAAEAERGQKFGAGQIIDILLGKRTAKVIQFDHDQLSVFGIGDELTEGEWRGVARQLLAQGLLAVEGGSTARWC